MSAEERAVFVEKAAEGRRRSGTRGASIARGRYAIAGISEDEIEILMSMSGPDRKAARLRWRDYGIKPSEIIAMRAAQDGLCPLCREPLPVSFHVDHNHTTGKARGLLCARCNLSLGHIEARGEEWATRALAWVAHHA